MNDPLEYVRRLAECARQEEPPRGDVLPKALAQLRLAGNKFAFVTPPLVRPWSIFAAGALTLAAVAAISIVSSYSSSMPDPILALFKEASINL